MLLKVKGGLEAWVTAGSSALYTATEGWAYICSVKVGNPFQVRAFCYILAQFRMEVICISNIV